VKKVNYVIIRFIYAFPTIVERRQTFAMIGPTLPPHLRKKKEENPEELDDRAEETVLPLVKPTVTGPQLPPRLLAGKEANRKRKREEAEDPQPSHHVPSPPSSKRSVPIGPTAPPEDSDSDSEVGPSVSAMMTPTESADHERKAAIARLSRISPSPINPEVTSAGPKIQRDSWMLAPPTRGEWLNGGLDASKLKSRTFNQSKSGKNSTTKSVDHTIWTETPMERAERLEEEVLGRKRPVTAAEVEDETKRVEALQRDRRIKEYNAQTRGPSLMDKYSASKKVEDDDPSKRAFDYQKDIAGGRTLGFKERDAMIGQAKNLDSKYSGGNYL
jgi:hypothetical protein